MHGEVKFPLVWIEALSTYAFIVLASSRISRVCFPWSHVDCVGIRTYSSKDIIFI